RRPATSAAHRYPRREAPRRRCPPSLLRPDARRTLFGACAAHRRQPVRTHDGQRVSARCAAGHSHALVRRRAACRRVVEGPPAMTESRLELAGDRVTNLLKVLEMMAAGDMEQRLQISDRHDELDAIAHGINVL